MGKERTRQTFWERKDRNPYFRNVRRKRRILFFREYGGWGDCLAVIGALQQYREVHPDYHITVAMLPWMEWHLRGVCDSFIPVTGETVAWLGEAGNASVYDEVIGYGGHRGMKRGHHTCPAAQHEADTMGRPYESRIETFSRVADVPPTPYTAQFTEKELRWGRRFVEKWKEPYVAISMFTSNPGKDWPFEKYHELMKRCQDITFFNLDATHSFFHGWPNVCNVIGYAVNEVSAIVANCDTTLSGDTFLVHLAQGCQMPSLSIWGPTDPVTMTRNYHQVSYLSQMDRKDKCYRPCLLYKRFNNYDCPPYYSRCLEEISVDEVEKKLRKILGGRHEAVA